MHNHTKEDIGNSTGEGCLKTQLSKKKYEEKADLTVCTIGMRRGGFKLNNSSWEGFGYVQQQLI